MTAKKHDFIPFFKMIRGGVIGAALLLAGCNAPAPPTTTATPFKPIPPPTATPLPTKDPVDLLPTVDPTNCTNILSYLDDLTIPDGSTIQPGAEIDKQWQIENSGTCNWREGYTLRQIHGPDLGAPESIPLIPVRAGTKTALSIKLKAPAETGTYTAGWQAYSPEGDEFGDEVFIDFVVP